MTIEELKENYCHYDRMRGHIFQRLISRDYCRKHLADMPRKAWMDLFLICYCRIESEEADPAAAFITGEWLQNWKIDERQLFEDAEYNRRQGEPAVLKRLDSVLAGYPGVRMLEQTPLYLLTNPNGIYGAVCITDPGIRQMAAHKLQGSYYILPSSIHECLLLPDNGEYDSAWLDQLVQEVNRTQLREQDVLADHVYRYDAALQCMEISGS